MNSSIGYILTNYLNPGSIVLKLHNACVQVYRIGSALSSKWYETHVITLLEPESAGCTCDPTTEPPNPSISVQIRLQSNKGGESELVMSTVLKTGVRR